MENDTNRPTAEEVVRRALALQLIVDRGWSDNTIQTGLRVHQKAAKKARKAVLKWVKKDGVWDWLSPKEREIWDQPFGKLSMEDRGFATWQLEPLVVLVWALGKVERLPEFSDAVKKEFYTTLHYCQDNAVEKILADTGLDPASTKLARTGEETKVYADAYMLCHWRAIERLVHNVKKLDMAEAAMQTFGNDIKPAVELLPMTKNGDLDIKQHGLTLREISKTDLTYFDKLFAGRQKALNWLVGYEADWDNVTTDT